jgi:hypothetical protein
MVVSFSYTRNKNLSLSEKRKLEINNKNIDLWLAGDDALNLLLGYHEGGPGAGERRLPVRLPQLVRPC